MIQIKPKINRIKVISCLFFQIYNNMDSFIMMVFLKMFVKIHTLHKLKIRLYTKLVSNLIDFSLFLNSLSLKYPKNTFL